MLWERFICPACGTERAFPFPAHHFAAKLHRAFCGTSPIRVTARLGEARHERHARFYGALAVVAARELEVRQERPRYLV